MRNILFALAIFATAALTSYSQAAAPADTKPAGPPVAAETKKRGPVFRATKSQIKEVQTLLKDKKLYAGEPTGALDDVTRASIRSFQKDNGLKETGTLNRATLEKMGVELTDTQKAIPASPNSYAAAGVAKSDTKPAGTEEKPKRVIFRATKEQIIEAQKILKGKSLYAGEESGKLDDATREGIRKFQAASGVKVTGTLNQTTLEKMGIVLTDKQKEAAKK